MNYNVASCLLFRKREHDDRIARRSDGIWPNIFLYLMSEGSHSQILILNLYCRIIDKSGIYVWLL
jgi:hypothetical protein